MGFPNKLKYITPLSIIGTYILLGCTHDDGFQAWGLEVVSILVGCFVSIIVLAIVQDLAEMERM